MNKTIQLFIRACKAKDADKRLRSVYRRFYYSTDCKKTQDAALVHILSKICEDHAPIRLTILMDRLNPENHWQYGITSDEGFNSAAIKILTSHLRFLKKDDLKGLTSPRRFRDD
jgi:hypothetical protein